MVKADLQQQINEQLFDMLELAYFCVDADMVIIDASENLSNYGYESAVVGANAEDCFDFIFGLDATTKLDLPMVESPSGTTMSVNLLPQSDRLMVLISNATTQADQRQLLQQKANENELLVERQRKLVAQVEKASRQLEQKNKQLREASRLQISFLSGVSHEFRTPLTSIIGYTNLVKNALQSKSATSDDEKITHLGAVQRSSKHLLSLIENLLDHGKLGSGEIVVRPKPIDLIELFQDVEILLKPLSQTKSIDLIVDIDIDDPSIVIIDDSRLRQCLINLVGNAIKFTDIGSVTLRAQLSDELLSIFVSDTGPGISSEDLKKIRLPFWQAADTGKAGTGLGLTITERIIDLMGGDLEINSELGAGTDVSFCMPAPSQSEQEVVEIAAQKTPNVTNMKVLLAEDDSDIADLMMMLMSERGFDVTHVDNGSLAVQMVESHQYDFVLMDIHMPVMTGYEALSVLQAVENTTPVVIMSASSVDDDRARAQELGCYDYLVKPVDIDDIIEIMSKVVVTE